MIVSCVTLLLVVSAALNGMVMSVYSVLLLVFNRFIIWKQIRMGGWRTGAMFFAVIFYGYFTVMVLKDQIPRLF
ncbi:MAG: hypothetical protein ACUZ8E_01830 [Candidatus Anammoxibacter sp.]